MCVKPPQKCNDWLNSCIHGHSFQVSTLPEWWCGKGCQAWEHAIDSDFIDNPLPEDLQTRESDTDRDEQVANDEHSAATSDSEQLVNPGNMEGLASDLEP